MRTSIVIQARLGSTRLPCKTLLTLHDLPVIDWVVRRCMTSRLADVVVVAIPDTERDDVLAKHIERHGGIVFRGSEEDVLLRMYEAAREHHTDTVVRVCADNPLICGDEIDTLIRFYQEHECDYAYNHIPEGNQYPDGFGAEVVSFSLLERINREATHLRHREHCLTYITDSPDRFQILTFDPPDVELCHPELRLDMDTGEDFIYLSTLAISPTSTGSEIVRAALAYADRARKRNDIEEI